MSINEALFTCVGSLGGLAFNTNTPICEHGTGDDGELEIKVTNLKSDNQASYNLEIYGLINGPSAVTNEIDSSIGQESDITCTAYSLSGIVLDLGTVVKNTVNFLAQERTSGFTMTTSPEINNVEATLTVTAVLN
jgi:hypothetical protein